MCNLPAQDQNTDHILQCEVKTHFHGLCKLFWSWLTFLAISLTVCPNVPLKSYIPFHALSHKLPQSRELIITDVSGVTPTSAPPGPQLWHWVSFLRHIGLLDVLSLRSSHPPMKTLFLWSMAVGFFESPFWVCEHLKVGLVAYSFFVFQGQAQRQNLIGVQEMTSE